MVFELRHYQGLRLKAIAEALGTSESRQECLFRVTAKDARGLGRFRMSASGSRACFLSSSIGELSFEEESGASTSGRVPGVPGGARADRGACTSALDRAKPRRPADLLADCRMKLRQELELGRGGALWPGACGIWLASPRLRACCGPPEPWLWWPWGSIAARLDADGLLQGPVDPSPAGPTGALPSARRGWWRANWRRRDPPAGAVGQSGRSRHPAASAGGGPGCLRSRLAPGLGGHSSIPRLLAAVRQALLQAVQSDPNDGVRLKAIQGLKPYAADAQTRLVLSKALLSDSNVGVRSQAVDLLVQQKGAALAGVLQQASRRKTTVTSCFAAGRLSKR